MEQNKCLKQLGVLAMHSECPDGCAAMKKVSDAIKQSASRENREVIAESISEIQCPEPSLMVLPKGRNRMR